MLFSELESMAGGRLMVSNDQKATAYSTDTRTLSGHQGEVFVAIKGERGDGHHYLEAARQKGVINFIVERSPSFKEANFLVVEDSLAALQRIATWRRSAFTYPVVGITGSNGKTTVKEWLSTLLYAQFYVVKSPRSYNSQIGVPLSVLAMRAAHTVGIFEAGISKVGEMSKLESIIRPNIGIFTTLGEAHDDGFSSREQKLKEKLILFKNAKKLICRGDTSWFPTLQKWSQESQVISWSPQSGHPYQIRWKPGTIHVNAQPYRTHLSGEAALENVTHCLIAATEMSISPLEIQKGLETLHPVPMRLELKKGMNECYILDDSYNNDLEGLKVAMDYLETHQQHAKKTLILSDILHSSKTNRQLYSEIAHLIVQKGFSRLIGVGNQIGGVSDLFAMDAQFYPSTDQLLQQPPSFDREMILVKGARDFHLEKVVNILTEKKHGTILEVNFESLLHNLNQYRNLLKPEVKLMVMVKANAYGGGLSEVAHFLQHQRVDQLGVAYLDEAIQLRNNGIHLPVMIMNPHMAHFVRLEQYHLQPEIFSIPILQRYLSETVRPAPVHLKIDTGMHRLGFSPKDIPDLKKHLIENPKLKVAGIFTHFSASDTADHDPFTQRQAALFNEIYEELVAVLGYAPLKHACNSAAIVRWPEYHYDMVRLGIGLHGFDPTHILNLKPVSALKTTISQIQSLHKGEAVGYARKGVVYRNSKIAILPVGYEDGFLRVFGNGNAAVYIKGKRCPTIGNVCMDMTMVDVTDTEAREGDEVVVFGKRPTIVELADAANTIPYEILTNISSRVPRIFISE